MTRPNTTQCHIGTKPTEDALEEEHNIRIVNNHDTRGGDGLKSNDNRRAANGNGQGPRICDDQRWHEIGLGLAITPDRTPGNPNRTLCKATGAVNAGNQGINRETTFSMMTASKSSARHSRIQSESLAHILHCVQPKELEGKFQVGNWGNVEGAHGRQRVPRISDKSGHWNVTLGDFSECSSGDQSESGATVGIFLLKTAPRNAISPGVRKIL
jgi:hypothetical protein